MSTHIYKIQVYQIQSIQTPHSVLFLKFNTNIENGSIVHLNIISHFAISMNIVDETSVRRSR